MKALRQSRSVPLVAASKISALRTRKSPFRKILALWKKESKGRRIFAFGRIAP